MPFHPLFQHAELNAQRVYQYVFKKDTIPPTAKDAVTKLSSKLLKLTEQFIEQQEMREHDFYAAYFRKKWFRKRHKSEWEEEALRIMQVVH